MSTVLLVERDRDTRDLLEALLQLRGFTAAVAESSHEALHRLEVEAFDLVISGFIVDNTDVAECWNQLADIRRLARGPIGILSGYPVDTARAADAGISFVLAKPCAATALLHSMSDALTLPPVSEPHAQLARAYFAALERGAYGDLVALCSPEVIYHLPRASPPLTERVTGRAGLHALAELTFKTFVEPRFEIESLSPLPHGALVRYSGSWLDNTETRRSLPGAVLFSFAGGFIDEVGVRCDLSEIPR